MHIKFFSNPVGIFIAVVVLFIVWYFWPAAQSTQSTQSTQSIEGFLGTKSVEDNEGFSDHGSEIVLFHLPTCGHCKNMMPEWNKFQKAHENDPKVNVHKIDCSKNPDTAEKNDVNGFPTIIKFKDGKKEVFEGERTAKALEGFLRDGRS
jgi:thiol-disulfide isomerase/thioredoxin